MALYGLYFILCSFEAQMSRNAKVKINCLFLYHFKTFKDKFRSIEN